MGLFDRITNGVNQAFGGADATLLAEGRLGRGQVLQVAPSGSTVQIMGGLVERTCTIVVRVLLDDTVPYTATLVQRVPEISLAQLAGAFVAIRVDAADPARVALDLRVPAPSVRIARVTGPGSAADILEHGSDAVVVLGAIEDCGYQDWRGWQMFRFELTVVEGVAQPYRMSAGNAVSPQGLALLYPGSRLHARVGAEAHQVVMDVERGAA